MHNNAENARKTLKKTDLELKSAQKGYIWLKKSDLSHKMRHFVAK